MYHKSALLENRVFRQLGCLFFFHLGNKTGNLPNANVTLGRGINYAVLTYADKETDKKINKNKKQMLQKINHAWKNCTAIS